MFGQRQASNGPAKVQSIIGQGCEVKGVIHSTGVVRVDGHLEGEVHHAGDLIVGPRGLVIANVKAKSMSIAGEVRGDVEVAGKLEILSSGRLYGDLRCTQLVVQEGAVIQGRSIVAGPDEAAPKPNPA